MQGQLARLTEFIGSDAEFWQSGLVARLQSAPLDGLQPPGEVLCKTPSCVKSAEVLTQL